MRRWTLVILFSILLNSPAVPLGHAASDTPDSGKSMLLNVPIFKVPLGSDPDSGSRKEKKQEEGRVKSEENKERDALDKKVDDAIKKAWGDEDRPK